MLGRETIQPVQLLLGIPFKTVRNEGETDPWVLELAENLRNVHTFARKKLKTTQLRQKRDYDLRVVQHQYQSGDLVYLLDSATKIGQSKKLRAPWKGPYLVVESYPPLYKIRDRKENKVVYHDRL